MPTDTTPLAVRPREAAKLLGLSTRTLYALTAPRGPIPAVKLGAGKAGAVLYRVADLHAWLAQAAGGSSEGGSDE